MPNLAKGSKRLLNAWAFYDWANSVYSLVIASAIFLGVRLEVRH